MLAPMKQILLCSALFAVPLSAMAEVPAQIVTATVLPGWRTDTGTHMAALQLRLAPGWKTYWRAPGEAGIPPQFDWSGSQNLKDVQLRWPRPQVFETSGMQTIGYHDELILPFEVRVDDTGAPVQIALQVDLGVCREVCVPASVTVSADLPVTGASDPAIRQALADQPGSGASVGLAALRCDVTPIEDGLRVTARMLLPPMGHAETVVLESQQPGIWVSQAATARMGDELVATVDMLSGQGQTFLLERDRVLVTILAGTQAVQAQGCPSG
jgi:DsbC/DsbD-like thiol-disulfide interchange protein